MRFGMTAIGCSILCLGLTGLSGPAGEKSGLGVGVKAPFFTLKDQGGKERTLGEFLAKGNVALVYYRSADW